MAIFASYDNFNVFDRHSDFVVQLGKGSQLVRFLLRIGGRKSGKAINAEKQSNDTRGQCLEG